jgi:hypothetical protein
LDINTHSSLVFMAFYGIHSPPRHIWAVLLNATDIMDKTHQYAAILPA